MSQTDLIASGVEQELQETDMVYMNQDQVAEFLGISPRTLEDWRYKGGGPPYRKIGRCVRYLRSQVIEWVESNEREHTSQAGA